MNIEKTDVCKSRILKSRFSYLTIVNIKKTDVGKSLILNNQVFVFDYTRISYRRMFENLGFL